MLCIVLYEDLVMCHMCKKTLCLQCVSKDLHIGHKKSLLKDYEEKEEDDNKPGTSSQY